MSALSDYAEALVLNWLFRNTGSAPTTLYVSLHTADPTDAGLTAAEVTGGGYTRKTVTFSAASSPAGTITNSNAPSWTASGGSWSGITHMAIWDASSAGNMLVRGALQQSRSVADGDTLTFNTSSITITLA